MNQIDRCSFPPSRGAAHSFPACRAELPITLPLRHGEVAGTKLHYELAGKLGAPLLIVAGGISAGRHVVASDAFPEAGWWQSQAGTFDFDAYRVLSIDWIGADGALDLPIDPADQAKAIRHLLDHLEIERAAAFIGASYGAMVGMHFAANHPDRLGGLLAMSASNASHPFTSACRALQRQAICLGEERDDPAAGVALARALAILTYRTPEEFAERFTAEPCLKDGRLRVGAEDYLDAQGARHCRRMTAVAYRRLSESIDLHRIDPAAINVPLTLVAVDLDWLVTTADIQAFAGQVAGANYRLINSRYGHDAFLKEEAQVAAIISEFLDTLETDQ